jgi:hypothetical protein
MDLRFGHALDVGFGVKLVIDRLLLEKLRRQALTIIGNFNDDVPAFMIG